MILRLFLLCGALLSFYVVLSNIRRSKMLIADCSIWFFIGLIGILLAVFPGISFFFSDLLEVESPVNLVYLIAIALLLLLVFKQALRISELEVKIKDLAQNITLMEKEKNKEDI